jgi:hypothetical protein
MGLKDGEHFFPEGIVSPLSKLLSIRSEDYAATAEDDETVDEKSDRQIEVSIEVLEFKFGAISFKYKCEEYDNK